MIGISICLVCLGIIGFINYKNIRDLKTSVENQNIQLCIYDNLFKVYNNLNNEEKLLNEKINNSFKLLNDKLDENDKLLEKLKEMDK